jgi:hypothetical protein
MATVVNDSFTGTDATVLSSHTGETGATWTRHTSTASGSFDIRANRTRCATAPADYYASGAPASADYDVVGTFRVLTINSAGSILAVTARYSTVARSGYFLQLNATTSGAHVWQLIRVDANVQTVLGSFATTFVANTTYVGTLRVRGSSIIAVIDGVERITATDATYSAKGVVGVRAGAGAGQTTGVHLDVFSTVDLLSGAAAVAGDGTIAASATRKAVAAASVSGAGAVAASATRKALAAAAVAGAGSVSASGTRKAVAAAALAGSGAIAASASRSAIASAALAGAGSIAAQAIRAALAQAEVQGTGGVNATGGVTRYGAADVAGGGALSASAHRRLDGAAAISGQGLLTAAAVRQVLAQGAIGGAGSMSAAALRTAIAAATIAGGGTTTGSAYAIRRAVASILGSGLIAATGRILAEPRGTIGTPRTNRIGSAPRTGLAITGKPRYGPPIP